MKSNLRKTYKNQSTPNNNIRLLAFILIVATLILFGIETWLVTAHSTWQDLHAASPDEAMIFECLQGSIFTFSSGYGPVFWGVLQGVISLAPKDSEILFARIFFVTLKYIAFALPAFALWRKMNYIGALLFLSICLTTPGYLFFGKIISPEYLILLLTAVTIFLLFEDNARIGIAYYSALLVSYLAVLTKISMLPLLASTLIYGIFMIIIYRGTKSWHRPLKQIFYLYLMLFIAIGLTITVSGLKESISEISAILLTVPKFSFSQENILLAWSRNDVTWDQIIAAGFQADFLPVLLTAIMGFFLLFAQLVSDWRKAVLPTMLYLTASLMLVNIVCQSMAFSWYLFIPSFLYFVVFAVLLENSNRYFIVLNIGILCVLFIYSGFERIAEHIKFKDYNNNQLFRHTEVMIEIHSFLSNNYPSIRTGNVDILVPTITGNAKKPRQSDVLPARIALNNVATKSWCAPDFLIINQSVYNHHSPIFDFIVKDSINQYEKVKSFQDLELYIKKE